MTTPDIQLSYLERKNGLQEVWDLIIKPCRSSEVLPSAHPFRRAKQQGQAGQRQRRQLRPRWVGAKNGAIPPRLAQCLWMDRRKASDAAVWLRGSKYPGVKCNLASKLQKCRLTLPLFREMKSHTAIYQLTQLNFWKTCNSSSSNNTKGETFPEKGEGREERRKRSHLSPPLPPSVPFRRLTRRNSFFFSGKMKNKTSVLFAQSQVWLSRNLCRFLSERWRLDNKCHLKTMGRDNRRPDGLISFSEGKGGGAFDLDFRD